MWQNLKTQIVKKLKNSNCDKTEKTKIVTKLKNQIVTKLKNSNCDSSNIDRCDSSSSDGSNSDIF